MDRNQAAQELIDRIKSQGDSSFLTEVATPGARPDKVNPKDIDHFSSEK